MLTEPHDAPTPLIWPRPSDAGASNDWTTFQAEIVPLLEARGFGMRELGRPLGHPLWLARRSGRAAQVRLLIATGFHGEEPAGPWGLLDFLRSLPQTLLERLDLSLLPLVNVSGFSRGLRLNARGENPNRGYGPHRGGDRPSIEGELLLAHGAELLAAARDGLLCAHEDHGPDATYVYSFEPTAEPGAFSRSLIATAARYFPVAPDGEIDGCTVRGGLIHNQHDGSFESWLVASGVPVAACVETPSRRDFGCRVAAQAALMLDFVAQRSL